MRTQFVRQVSLVIVLGVVMTLAGAPAAAALPRVVITSGSVDAVSDSWTDVFWGFGGANFSSGGDVIGVGWDDPMLGTPGFGFDLQWHQTTWNGVTYPSYTLPDDVSPGWVSFNHAPLCAPAECWSDIYPGPWEVSVPFTMEGLVQLTPDLAVHLVGRGTLHASACPTCGVEGFWGWTYSYTFAAVPEPPVLLLLGSALGGLGVMARVTRRTP